MLILIFLCNQLLHHTIVILIFLVYIVHYCYSIRKLTMAQELPKHVFSQI